MAVSDYKTNPDENTTISGINIAEGCAPSGINNAIRQLMADVRQNADEQDDKYRNLSLAEVIATGSDTPRILADWCADIRLNPENAITYVVGGENGLSSINEAIYAAYKKYNPIFKTFDRFSGRSESSYDNEFSRQSERICIKIASGFVVREQIVMDGLDLSFMTIVSEDDAVEVDTSAFRVCDSEHRYPLFLAVNGAKSPVIDCLFEVPVAETYVPALTCAFSSEHGGEIFIAPQKGAVNFERGVGCYFGGKCTCTLGNLTIQEGGAGTTMYGAVLKNCRGRAIMVAHGSSANLPRTMGTGCSGDICVYVIWDSFLNVYQSDFYGYSGGGDVIYVRDGSSCCARETCVSAAPGTSDGSGYHALHSARIDARYYESSWAPSELGWHVEGAHNLLHAVQINYGSQIDCANLPCVDCTGTSAIQVQDSSTVSARDVKISGGKRGFEIFDASSVTCDNAIISGCQYQAIDVTGSMVSAEGVQISDCGVGIYGVRNSNINASNAVLTDCKSGLYLDGYSTASASTISITGKAEYGVRAKGMSTIGMTNATINIQKTDNSRTCYGVSCEDASKINMSNASVTDAESGRAGRLKGKGNVVVAVDVTGVFFGTGSVDNQLTGVGIVIR